MNEPKQTQNTKNHHKKSTDEEMFDEELEQDEKQAQLKEQSNEVQDLLEKISQLEQQLSQAKDKELRALADYNNLLRRTREESTQLTKFATKSLMEDLLEPLEHLSMTAEQIKNNILDMVIGQLWSVLKNHGLQELDVMGRPFDLRMMEVVDLVDGATEKEGVVVKVVKRGYSLNGEVIQHAKVVIGKK